MQRKTFKDFKTKALQNEEVEKEFEILTPEYEIKKKLY